MFGLSSPRRVPTPGATIRHPCTLYHVKDLKTTTLSVLEWGPVLAWAQAQVQEIAVQARVRE